MKTFLKNVLYIFPILICVAFLATVDRIVKVERETLLAKQYATTVEDIDEIDKIVRFADKKVDKDTNFMFWVDQLIGAATCDEVIAVVLDDELKPLGRRHRWNRKISHILKADSALMNVVCHNDIGGVVVTNEQVSHYDALLYFKWIVYNHDRYCILTVTKAIEDTTLKNYLISYLLILTVIVSAMEVYIVGVKCNHKCKSKNATNNNRFNSNNAIRTARHRGRCSEGTRTLKQKRI